MTKNWHKQAYADEITHDFTGKSGILYIEIFLPDNAPPLLFSSKQRGRD